MKDPLQGKLAALWRRALGHAFASLMFAGGAVHEILTFDGIEIDARAGKDFNRFRDYRKESPHKETPEKKTQQARRLSCVFHPVSIDTQWIFQAPARIRPAFSG